MRLFFAIGIDDAARSALASAVEAARGAPRLPHGLRWLAPDGWHFTLQFLGEVDAGRVAELEAAASAAAAPHSPFELALGAAGTFGSARRARLVHVGVSRGSEAMVALAKSVRERTAALGFEPEARAFVPHLTLARMREPSDVRPALDALRIPATAMRVERLTLMRSHLAQTGARYEPIAQARLGVTG